LNAAIAYANTGDFTKALFDYNEALALSKKYGLIEEEARVLYNIALLYEDKDPVKAQKYHEEVLKLAMQMGLKHLMVEVYQSLYILQKKQGNYKAAIEFLEKFHVYQDSVMSIENTSAIELLQSNFDLEKSKVEIKELEIANQKQRSNQIIAFLIIGGTLFSLGIVAYNSRKRNRLNKELLKSIQVRDKLLSIITHDLKSPINNILGLINELEGDGISEQERKILLETLKKQTSLSLDTLENILKWGQAQIKGIKTNPQILVLKDVIEHNKDLVELNLLSKNIQLNMEFDNNLKLKADKDQVDFVIRNLISNAIKYSKSGSTITIKAYPTGNGEINIEVIDEGIGMSKETLDSLFGVKQKINLGTMSEKGSGLGLLLCKEFVEANNGSISAKSILGNGSTFTFTCTSA
jgi:signal transduction histidine kinase